MYSQVRILPYIWGNIVITKLNLKMICFASAYTNTPATNKLHNGKLFKFKIAAFSKAVNIVNNALNR
jgi:hypothetical protein